MRQYIGARYVIMIYENTNDPSSAEWQPNVTYEPLTLVTYQNGSYLSKKKVPATVGNPPSNPAYWIVTGNYNGQIANLQQQIDALNKIVVDNTDLRTSGYPFAVGDVISVAKTGANFLVVSTSSPITVPLHNGKYAELLPDENGAYHVSALGLANNADIYPILQYMLNNGIYDIYINNGNYRLSQTLTLPEPTPQIKIIGESMNKTIINCTQGFLNIALDSYNFRSSEIGCLNLVGTATGAVGGDYHGIAITTKNNDPNDMGDYLRLHDIEMRYFKTAIRLEGRFIWNEYENLTIHYCAWGFYFSCPQSYGFFNNNTFINCQFDTNKYRGFTIVANPKQAISNVMIGCSIEANHHGTSYYGHNAEIELHDCSFMLIGCHFERGTELNTFEAIYAEKSNVRLDECSFVFYGQNVIANEGSIAIFNQCNSIGSSMTARVDTGTTQFNNTFTYV